MHNHHEERQLDKKGLRFAFGLTFTIMLAEISGGFISNSLALLSDAGHMFTDTFALGLSLWALTMAQKPATHQRTYGYHRLEILAALANGLLLLGVAGWIFYEAILRLFHPAEIKSGVMIAVSVIGLVANFIGLTVLQKSSQENLNVRGAFLHMLSDTLSSVGVIIGGVLIFFTGWKFVDPIVSILINGFILHSAILLIFESGEVLLEYSPRGLELNKLVAEIKKVNGVKDLHGLHVWTITSGVHALSGHLLLEDQKISEGNEILSLVEEIMAEKFHITHTTLQLECEHCEKGLVCQEGNSNKRIK